MKLYEHKDFEQAVLRAEEHFRARGLKAAFIEKDYYVTEALRLVASAAEGKIIFKGGTSLSKGWNLIDRFSEDVDIFLNPADLGNRAIDRELKRIRDVVAGHSGLTLQQGEGQTVGGFGRSDRYSYTQRFGGAGAIANRVLLEIGTASGNQPVEIKEIRSYLAEFLEANRLSLGAEDEAGFVMPLLHFRRTFVEKMFAIHDKVDLLKRDGRPIGSYARHYYDLVRLAATPEVLAMLNSAEYAEIKADYDRISKEHFAKNYHPPEQLSFAHSDALFPSGDLSVTLGKEYDAQCRVLCYTAYPKWEEVQNTFAALRDRL